MKVTTDGCLFGAWLAERVRSSELGVRSLETVLDIGTGTGLLSLMLAQKNPGLQIDAIEIDKEAAEQAVENVRSSPWKDRINVIYGDARNQRFPKKYDLILSNPPFYENELKAVNAKQNMAHHNEGLLFSAVLDLITGNLSEDGYYFLLLPYKRNKEIKKILIDHALSIQHITFVRQSMNHDYFRLLVSGSRHNERPVETMINEIVIKDGNDHYTPEFTRLLEPYYLHL